MSGEFGSYSNGYFHSQIDYAAHDCLKGRAELTRLLGQFFRSLIPLSDEISYYEAGDSGWSDLMLAAIKTLPSLESDFKELEEYIKRHEELVEAALEKVSEQ